MCGSRFEPLAGRAPHLLVGPQLGLEILSGGGGCPATWEESW